MPASDSLRLVVFDLDGTLVDSERTIVACMGDACAAVGVAAPPAPAVRRMVGLPLDTAIARLFPDAGPADLGRLLAGYRESAIARRRAGTVHEPLFPGVAEALDVLDGGGWLLGIATGKPRRGLVATLEPHGLLARFITLQTADHGPGKPSPAMLLRAMGETGVEATRTVMVGDTSYDMEMARAAGAVGIGVAWGYHAHRDLVDAGARAVVHSFAELPHAVERALEEA